MNEFINLYLIPMISLYLHYKRRQKIVVFSAYSVMIYSLYTLFVHLFSKILYLVYCYAFGDSFSFDSIIYTVIAIPVAAVLPSVIDFLRKNFSISVEIVENTNNVDVDSVMKGQMSSNAD